MKGIERSRHVTLLRWQNFWQTWQEKKNEKLTGMIFRSLMAQGDKTVVHITFRPSSNNANDRPCLERLVKSRNLAAIAT